MPRTHEYSTSLTWTGNRGTGTSGYRDYDRRVESAAAGRPVLLASADRAFRGDDDRWNPELLLVAALSQCHLLSYLHCCVEAGVMVVEYQDDARGVMVEDGNGGGAFTEVILSPRVVVADAAMLEAAYAAHEPAAARCFIAASVAFPVRHEPQITAGER